MVFGLSSKIKLEAPSWWSDLPEEMQAALVELGWGNRDWLSNPDYPGAAPDWVQQERLMGYFGFLSPGGLAPLYVGGLFTRAFTAGQLTQFGLDPGAYGYTARQQAKLGTAADYFSKYPSAYNVSQGDLFLARGAYYGFQQGWTPVAETWSAIRLGSYFSPELWTIRALGFPFYSAAQQLGAGAAMASDVQAAYAADPTNTMSKILSSPTFWAGHYPNTLSTVVSGLFEWTFLQSIPWVLGGPKNVGGILGVGFLQAGLGIAMAPLATYAVRGMWGVPAFAPGTNEYQSFVQQELLGWGLAGLGGLMSLKYGAFATRTPTATALGLGGSGGISPGVFAYDITGQALAEDVNFRNVFALGRGQDYAFGAPGSRTLAVASRLFFGTVGWYVGGYAGGEIGEKIIGEQYGYPAFGRVVGTAIGELGGSWLAMRYGPVLAQAVWERAAPQVAQDFLTSAAGRLAPLGVLGPIVGAAGWSYAAALGVGVLESSYYSTPVGQQAILQGQQLAQQAGGPLWSWQPPWGGPPITIGGGLSQLYPNQPNAPFYGGGLFMQPNVDPKQSMFYQGGPTAPPIDRTPWYMRGYYQPGVNILAGPLEYEYGTSYAASHYGPGGGPVQPSQFDYATSHFGPGGTLQTQPPEWFFQQQATQAWWENFNRLVPTIGQAWKPTYPGSSTSTLRNVYDPAASRAFWSAYNQIGYEQWSTGGYQIGGLTFPGAGQYGPGGVIEPRIPIPMQTQYGFTWGQAQDARYVQGGAWVLGPNNTWTWVAGATQGGRGISTDVTFTAGLSGHLYGAGGGWQGKPTGWQGWDYEEKAAWIAAHPGLTRPLTLTGGTFDPYTGTWSGPTRTTPLGTVAGGGAYTATSTFGIYGKRHWSRATQSWVYESTAYRSTKESPSDVPSWEKLTRSVTLYQTSPPAAQDDSGRIEMVTMRVIRGLVDSQVLLSGDAGRWSLFQSEEIVNQLSTPLAKRILDDVSRH